MVIKWTHVQTGLVQYATTHKNLHSMMILELHVVLEWESDIQDELWLLKCNRAMLMSMLMIDIV